MSHDPANLDHLVTSLIDFIHELNQASSRLLMCPARICNINRSSVCSLEIMVMASGKQGNCGSGEGKLYAESNDV